MEKQELNDIVKDGMEKAVKSLQNELQRVRTGRASTSLLDDVKVDSYGTKVPLNQAATLATPEARLITVNPFDKSQLPAIEKAILVSGLGLTPNNDGKIVRIPIPPLSEERRKEIAKQVKKLGEDAKVAVRHARQEGNAKAKSGKDFGWSEDEVKKVTADVQKLTDTYVKKVDEVSSAKEKEILSM